jgi:hypothetical protein
MSTFNEQLQLSEYVMWRFKENAEDGTYAWLRLALYALHHKYQNKKQEAFVGEANIE